MNQKPEEDRKCDDCPYTDDTKKCNGCTISNKPWNEDELQLLFSAAIYWQTKHNAHPMTCGIDSEHDPLVPIISGNTVILQCPNCKWVQREWEMEQAIELYRHWQFEDPMNDPDYRPKVLEFLEKCQKEDMPRPSVIDIMVNCGLPRQAQEVMHNMFDQMGNYQKLLAERKEWGKVFYEELKHRLRNGESGDDFLNFQQKTVLGGTFGDSELSGIYRSEDDVLLIFRTLVGMQGKCDDCGKGCDPDGLYCEKCDPELKDGE